MCHYKNNNDKELWENSESLFSYSKESVNFFQFVNTVVN